MRNVCNLLLAIAAAPLSERALNAATYCMVVYFVGLKSPWPITMPLYAQIEPSDNCNLNCCMCPVSKENRGHKPGDLSYDNFAKMIDALPSALHIQIQGFGEPLLNKNIVEMVRYSKSKGNRTTLVTNGQLLTKGMCEKLIGSGLDAIGISIDGAKKQTYESIRSGASFDRLISNITMLVKIRKASGSQMRIYLMFVMMNENFDELSNLVRMCSKLGLDGVRSQHVQLQYNVKGNRLRSVFSGKHRKKIEEEVKTSRRLSRENNLDCNFQGFERSRHMDCHWPWAGVYIKCNGEVTPCCNITQLSFGNILQQPFGEIWKSEKYCRFRKQHAKNRISKICKGCNYAYFNGEIVVL